MCSSDLDGLHARIFPEIRMTWTVATAGIDFAMHKPAGHDPSGVPLELTPDARAERMAPPQIPAGRMYREGSGFFDPARYAGVAKRIATF